MNISVIIPVYNAVNFIEKAVYSALQFAEVKEVLLVEDGCPFGSLAVCKKLAEKESRVLLVNHPNGENRGAGASRNLGIKTATQEFIAFLDADDFFLKNRFEEDKKIFDLDQSVEGIYNPISSHFYTEKAKLQRAEFINVSVSDVEKYDISCIKKREVDSKEIYKGLLYLIRNFGHFSVIGLTVKTESLKNITEPIFMEGSFYEDKEFTIKLAYHCKLVPGSLFPVSKRGVHAENRITKHKENQKTHYYNKYKFFRSLKKWSSDLKINDEDVKNIIDLNYTFFKILSTKSKFTKIAILLGKPIVFFTKHYRLIHEDIVGENIFTEITYRIVTKILSYFKKQYTFAKQYYIPL